MREKIQANREGRVINPAAIAKTPATPAIPYPNKTAATYLNNMAVIYPNKTAVIYPNNMAVIYPDKIAVIYPDKAVNLSELKNQRGVRLSHPKISKRLGGITREAVNRPIYPGVNKEPQVKGKRGRYISGSWPALPKRKLKSFKLILKLMQDNKKTVTIKAKALREKARAKQNR